jgi:CheY-like chemotaxis protein
VSIQQAEEIAPAEAGPSLINLRILVVDDEAGAREVTSAILAHGLAQVRTAESAKDARLQAGE